MTLGSEIQNNKSEIKQAEKDKRALFYTKFEGNTAGDETFLKIIHNAVITELPNDAEIGLYLAYDKKSEKRAKNALEMWFTTMVEKGFDKKKLKAWSYETPMDENKAKKTEQGTAVLSRCFLNQAQSYMPKINDQNKEDKNTTSKLINFVKGNNNPLDLLVIAGWAHQLNNKGAEHLKNELKIPNSTKILLCTPPGGYIDNRNSNRIGCETSMKTALINRGAPEKEEKVYCLQPGVYAAAGLPISPSVTQETLQDVATRDEWVAHITQHLPTENNEFILNRLKKSKDEKDKLIVIYCSKDGPGPIGIDFLGEIYEKENGDEYPVLLLGAIDNEGNESTTKEEWEQVCADVGFSPFFLPRTVDTKIFMCGLQDAQYSMTTGAFSILEAKKLDIKHCAYLAPPHLQAFAKIIQDATSEELQNAYRQGGKTLEELSHLPVKDFKADILHHKNGLQSIDKEIELKKCVRYVRQREEYDTYQEKHINYIKTRNCKDKEYTSKKEIEAYDKFITAYIKYKQYALQPIKKLALEEDIEEKSPKLQ